MDFARFAFWAFVHVCSRNRHRAAVVAVPCRNAMPPPQLSRDAPVANVVHPFVIGFRPVGRNELNATLLDRRNSGIGQWFYFYEPLFGKQWFHNRRTTLTLSNAMQ